MNGFDKIQKELKKTEQAAQELDGEHSVSFGELFDQSFMKKHTTFNSFKEFLSAGSFNAETDEAFDAIPDADLDNHVSTSTKFKDWEDMLDTASEDYAFKKLGF